MGRVYPPLLVYVSRWFERRRGAAIAFISSGQYVAGVLWPSLFERGLAEIGWQTLMLGYAGVVLVLVVPATFLLKSPPLAATLSLPLRAGPAQSTLIASLHPNMVQPPIFIAGSCCCIPMAVPAA